MAADTPASPPRVLVAVPTYRRGALLPALVEAIRNDARAALSATRLLIVDNDPAQSARPVAIALDAAYLAEPVPGIAAARQAALDAAEADELVVMIDDDLVPEPGWLAGLVDAWRAHRPAAVMGFVRYVWPEGTDPWIAAGGFMRRTRFPTGTRLSALSTGNVLIDAAQVRALGIRFDVGLGLSGGSDLEFGRALLAAGGTIVASAESVARDDIAPERTTAAFVHRRAICQGQVRARLMSRDPLPAARLAKRAGHLVGGLVRVPAFAAGEAIARLRGDVPASAVYRRRRWFAQGRVLGALGHVRHEYARDLERGDGTG
jgi:succinoglycan biosynthesis protein ExoM